VLQTLSRKTLYKKGLVEWLKVKALSSNPSTARKKKNQQSDEFSASSSTPRMTDQNRVVLSPANKLVSIVTS
jgi:hypothetical protein